MYLRFSMKLNSNIFDSDYWGTVGLFGIAGVVFGGDYL